MNTERDELRRVAQRGCEALVEKLMVLRLEFGRVAQACEAAMGAERMALEMGDGDFASLISSLRRELVNMDVVARRREALDADIKAIFQ